MEFGGVKETVCTRCSHRPVCAYVEDLLKAQWEFDNSDFGLRLKNTDWFVPISIKCKHADCSIPVMKGE